MTRPIIPAPVSTQTLNATILTEDSSTRDEQPTEIINLRDGDTYDLTIGKVRKTINGNKQIMLAYNRSIP